MAENPDYKSAISIHEFTVKNIKGEDVKLDVYKDHVCIIANVASKCGLTANQYKQLNELYEQYAESKGTILGNCKQNYISNSCCLSLVLYFRY